MNYMKEREKKSRQSRTESKVMSTKFTVLSLLLITLVIAGCQGPAKEGTFRDSIHKNPPYAVETRQISAGKSVEQRDINYTVHGSGGEVTLIIAGIHGNEKAGIAIANKLDSVLAERPYKALGRTIVILPVANPDGYAKNSRFNARNIDINRNFATFNRIDNNNNGQRGLSEPESIALAKIIYDYNPSKIISLHSSLACIDYDGPAEAIAKRISSQCSLPITKLGSRPGSLGTYAGFEKAVPMITVEFTPDDETLGADRLWEKYEKAIFAGIYYEYIQIETQKEKDATDSTDDTGLWESDIRSDDGVGQYH
jgi:protein MpaA